MLFFHVIVNFRIYIILIKWTLQFSIYAGGIVRRYDHELLQFGIYADGIEALVGDAAEGEETTEATAGLSLTMMDVLLRPVEFFRGMSGLMSAVWNAPSEPVSALQVTWSF